MSKPPLTLVPALASEPTPRAPRLDVLAAARAQSIARLETQRGILIISQQLVAIAQRAFDEALAEHMATFGRDLAHGG